MGQHAIIDLDDPATWPQPVAEWAREQADTLRGSTIHTADLGGTFIEREQEFRSLFGEHSLKALHCTRLFEDEVAAIRTQGLRRLSRELVTERLSNAHARGFLSDDERADLEVSNVFARGGEENREGHVCLILGRAAFDDDRGGCDPLLGTWGGEGINGGPLPGSAEGVRQFGQPTIIVARINPGVSQETLMTFPSLPKLFVGTLLCTEGQHADVILRSNVPPNDILEIWHPGDLDYDRHRDLPRL